MLSVIVSDKLLFSFHITTAPLLGCDFRISGTFRILWIMLTEYIRENPSHSLYLSLFVFENNHSPFRLQLHISGYFPFAHPSAAKTVWKDFFIFNLQQFVRAVTNNECRIQGFVVLMKMFAYKVKNARFAVFSIRMLTDKSQSTPLYYCISLSHMEIRLTNKVALSTLPWNFIHFEITLRMSFVLAWNFV